MEEYDLGIINKEQIEKDEEEKKEDIRNKK